MLQCIQCALVVVSDTLCLLDRTKRAFSSRKPLILRTLLLSLPQEGEFDCRNVQLGMNEKSSFIITIQVHQATDCIGRRNLLGRKIRNEFFKFSFGRTDFKRNLPIIAKLEIGCNASTTQFVISLTN